MFNDLDATLVLVVGVQLALAGLLYVLARLEPAAAPVAVAVSVEAGDPEPGPTLGTGV